MQHLQEEIMQLRRYKPIFIPQGFTLG